MARTSIRLVAIATILAAAVLNPPSVPAQRAAVRPRLTVDSGRQPVVVPTAGLRAQRRDTVVLFAGRPAHASVGTLVEELTVGQGSDAQEYHFTGVRVTLARDGSIYVIDRSHNGPAAIRKYDGSGKYVRSFGRPGRGPGEFVGQLGDVRELSDGRVLVSDGLGLLVYSPTGEPLARWNVASGLDAGSRILLDTSTFIHIVEQRRNLSAMQPGVRGLPPLTSLVIRLRPDGVVEDTIRSPHGEFPARAMIERQFIPFSPSYLFAWSPLGYWVTAHSATYAIDLRIPPATSRQRLQVAGGRSAPPPTWHPANPVQSIRRTVAPVPVQDAERSDWRESLELFIRRNKNDLRWQWNGPDIPRVKPALRGLFVAEDGRIWVQLSQRALLDPSVTIRSAPEGRNAMITVEAARRWEEPIVYDVLEPTGRYVGQVSVPRGVWIAGARGDTVWGVVLDANDVPLIKRYRVAWGTT